MKILFFGIYDPSYARNRILLDGLRRAGHTVLECRVDPRKERGFRKYRALFKEGFSLSRQNFDFVFVGFPGHSVVWLAYLLFGRKRLVFDMFVSLFDSNVHDRKIYTLRSFFAMRDWFMDWYSGHLARVVFIDTKQNAEYVKKNFNIFKIKVLPVGAVESVFYPRPDPPAQSVFKIHFHGSYIPLHGIKYILSAAKLCSDRPYRFIILGDGQEYAAIQKEAESLNLSNVSFVKRVPIEELPLHIASADLCLGIFGDSEKTKRVIPNKVYEYLAMAKPVVSADTPAMQEYFVDKTHVCLCKAANPHSIVEAIDELYKNPALRKRVAENGNALFLERFSEAAIIRTLVGILQS